MGLIERFIRYVKIDTQSDADSITVPSTKKQFDLLNLLKQELMDLGVKELHLDPTGNLYATIPASKNVSAPSIGFMAHVDTASEMSGKNVNPQIIKNYNGKAITLHAKEKILLDPNVFPSLKLHRGKTLVTTDGTTLLGADDKAGVAIIMTFVEHIMKHKEVLHGPIQIGFTSDEEIGRGVVHFDPKLFKADFAYTLDGGPIGEINFENFNASSAVVTVQGKAIHPGSAKDQMINSQTIASAFHLGLPNHLKPETTDGYKGFIHLTQSVGGVEKTELRYIIRHHDLKQLKQLEKIMINLAASMNKTWKQKRIHLEIKPSYLNMAPEIKKKPEGLNRALRAYQSLGISVKPVPIRGGTDGANLTYKGVPTPNLATGGENYHGKYEFLVVEDAERMVKVLEEIVRIKA
ncbi:MAG: peptidase [Bacillota bacterium]|jgi:tripeptide aminopeptidase